MTRTPTQVWAEYAQAQGQRLVISGAIGAGKTTWCSSLVAHVRQQGKQVAGLLSTGVFVDGQKVAIDLLDLSSNTQRRLATRRTAPDATSPTPNWQFDASTLAWGDDVLRAVERCDLLVIDELGPLELTYQQGWQHALTLLERRAYRLACVVVRRSLLGAFLGIFADAITLEITSAS